ncbi:hypothetical protein M758_12G029800 [Ceratodon purpureus]|nr:hypothetical protein M758_12G029800 [Ceratodon purpureus]
MIGGGGSSSSSDTPISVSSVVSSTSSAGLFRACTCTSCDPCRFLLFRELGPTVLVATPCPDVTPPPSFFDLSRSRELCTSSIMSSPSSPTAIQRNHRAPVSATSPKLSTLPHTSPPIPPLGYRPPHSTTSTLQQPTHTRTAFVSNPTKLQNITLQTPRLSSALASPSHCPLQSQNVPPCCTETTTIPAHTIDCRHFATRTDSSTHAYLHHSTHYRSTKCTIGNVHFQLNLRHANARPTNSGYRKQRRISCSGFLTLKTLTPGRLSPALCLYERASQSVPQNRGNQVTPLIPATAIGDSRTCQCEALTKTSAPGATKHHVLVNGTDLLNQIPSPPLSLSPSLSVSFYLSRSLWNRDSKVLQLSIRHGDARRNIRFAGNLLELPIRMSTPSLLTVLST